MRKRSAETHFAVVSIPARMRTHSRLLTIRSSWRNLRQLPLTPEPGLRVAQISHPGILFDNASFFPTGRVEALRDFGPQVLIGSRDELNELTVEIAGRQTSLAELDRAVFVLTDLHSRLLTDTDREQLWRSLAAPVYELFMGEDGALLASECEAREGWHVAPGVVFSLPNDQLWYRTRRNHLRATGLTGSIEEQPCRCGRPGKRIMNAALDLRDPVRQRLANIA